MKHLDSMEVGTEKAHDLINSEIGDELDSTFAQDQDDCEHEGFIDHPDFAHIDPLQMDQVNPQKQAFRLVDLYDMEIVDALTRSLDEDQREVLDIGVSFAKSVVRSKCSKLPRPLPELIVVQGGAGSGKSTVIDILSQHIEKILRSPGDNPDHPYIIKAAFTGAAACLISGQTLF